MNYDYVGYNVGKFILPYLSFTALASTFGLFLCGISICNRIRQLGNADTTSGVPFLIAFVSCAFWLQYGLIKEDNVVIFCNFVGLTLQSAYLLYYYSMLRNRVKLSYTRKVIIAELILIALMIYLVNFGNFRTGQIIEVLGAICIVLNIATIGAPLASVGEVIRTKSTESMPLPLCIASFLVSAQWLLYGIIVDDFVIRMPNYIATAISAVQLSLFIIYSRTTAATKKMSPLPSHSSDTD